LDNYQKYYLYMRLTVNVLLLFGLLFFFVNCGGEYQSTVDGGADMTSSPFCAEQLSLCPNGCYQSFQCDTCLSPLFHYGSARSYLAMTTLHQCLREECHENAGPVVEPGGWCNPSFPTCLECIKLAQTRYMGRCWGAWYACQYH